MEFYKFQHRQSTAAVVTSVTLHEYMCNAYLKMVNIVYIVLKASEQSKIKAPNEMRAQKKREKNIQAKETSRQNGNAFGDSFT